MTEQASYPVMVEYTTHHIVWVEATDHDAAVRHVQSYPYDFTRDEETANNSGCTVRKPEGQFDWEDVYDDPWGYPYSTAAEAHIEAYRHEQWRVKRAANMAACLTAGHPKTQTYSHGTFCDVCGKLPEAVAPC